MKQRICNWARRRLPPGLEPEGELKLMAGSLAVMALISAVGFSGRLESGIQALYRVLGQDRKVLWPEARMIPFYQLLPETAVFFAAAALAFGLWLGFWLYCRQESRADYRLRLLPDRWERFRRTVPAPAVPGAGGADGGADGAAPLPAVPGPGAGEVPGAGPVGTISGRSAWKEALRC